MLDIFLKLIMYGGILLILIWMWLNYINYAFTSNTTETNESLKGLHYSKEDTHYKDDNEDTDYKHMVIMPEAFVTNPDAYKNGADTTYIMKPIAKNFWKICANKLIGEGYLIKVLENKYILCFGCFIDKLEYTAFKRSYRFFYADNNCRVFGDYIKETSTGTECTNLKDYGRRYTDGAAGVMTWDCSSNFLKDKFPFLNASDDLKLVLLFRRTSNRYDDFVSAGIGIVLDESEIIFK